MILMTIACFLILLAVAAYIVVKAIQDIEITQWQNMGIFCIGVAGVTGINSYTKALQKKTELNGKSE